MIGETISHYKILEKLGEGGMGVVYKAQDTKLKRTVALKFLPPELTRDPEAKQRFIHEAQAASALDHSNICTIHEIDETKEGQTFIVMACYEGETLQEKIERGPLKIEEAFNMASQIAEGLYEAHEKSIVHRDIKPANIMITTKGQVKIMDFGLAKLRGQKGLTKEGTTVGTVAYMSPEQARGDEVDHRTDVWSLGVILYEMLTGQLPFKGEYDQAVIYSVLNEDPKPPSILRKEIPPYLEQIVIKILEKMPNNRHQSMQEVLEEIKVTVVDSAKSQKQHKSIVVLPFVNMSPDLDQEYFSDGLTEEIITDLSKLKKLRVISRTSAMMLKQTQKPIRTIGRELDVQFVLEGSVRKADQNLRITVQLIDAQNDNHIWAEKYNGTLGDVFDIQEKLSRSIVDEIKYQLSPEEESIISEREIENIEAYEYYLKARREIYTLTRQGLDNALQYLKKGIDVVGENVLLYACMGNVYYQYWNYGVWTDLSNIKKAEECAKRIFELEPDSKHGHFLLGLLQIFLNPPQALIHFKRVLSIDPYHPETLLWLSIYLVFQGKQEFAEIYLDRLNKIDPLNPIVRVLPGNLHFHCGRLGLALKSLKEILDSDPEHFVAQFHYSRTLIYANRYEDAIVIIDNLVSKSLGDMRTYLFQLYKYAILGKKQDVMKSLTQEFLTWVRRDWMACLWLSEIFDLINENEEALYWLKQAVNLGFINYPFLNEYDHLLKNIRGEVQFQKLMEEIKPKWKSFRL